MSSLNSDEAIKLTIQCVPCSTCKALIGEKCRSLVVKGREWKVSVHASRRWDMTSWRKVKANKAIYKQRREEIAALRSSSKPLPDPIPNLEAETKPN